MSSEDPTSSAVARPSRFRLGWAAMGALGHAPGIWMMKRLVAVLGWETEPPRFGRQTIRLNVIAITTTLVATAALAVAISPMAAAITFAVGHFLWSGLLAARIWTGAIER